jgi:predicted phosphodiesterase
VHGSPRRINEYLFEDREEKSLLRIMQEADADMMCFGHTHKPYHRILPGGTDENPHYRHAINSGSVGKPKDGDPRGCYVLLHINENSNTGDKESIRAEFVRFEYDIEKAAKAIENSALPPAFAEALRKAK